MALTSNQAGQMYALTVLAPIVPERLEGLRAYLDELPRDAGPLARLDATHFGRFVIVDGFKRYPPQRRPEDLPCPYLLFSATFDGELAPYLDALCLLPEAEAIWGACEGAPSPASGADLAAYLVRNQIQTGLFFSAYADATVAQVRRSLECRARVRALAEAGQDMDPAALQQAFLTELAP